MKRGPCIWTWNLPDIGLKGFSPLHSPFTTMGSWLQQQQQLTPNLRQVRQGPIPTVKLSPHIPLDPGNIF